MSQQPEVPTSSSDTYPSHSSFARRYERDSQQGQQEAFFAPLRREVTGLAHGRVLEIGAGNGLNFAFYPPERITSVEAIEPDSTMLSYARARAAEAQVPVHLTRAVAEQLPFADASFDSVVVTLVFCSVSDPTRSMSEIRRVLKPGGTLLMVEHVRSRSLLISTLQNIATPLTRRFAGNCHWNRATEQTLIDGNFTIEQRRELSWFMMPFILLQAVR